MNTMVKVNFRNLETKEYPKGTTFYEISKEFQKYYNFPILVAKVNNEITRLSKEIDKKCTVEFYDRSSITGNTSYASSVQFMLILAVRNILGINSDVMIQNSIDNGVYCEVRGAKITQKTLKKIEDEMTNISKNDYIFTKLNVSRMDAIEFYKKKKLIDKANVLKYISNTYVNLYRLDDMYDYFFGEMAYSTSQIDSFKLTYIKEDGFILSYPNIYTPDYTMDYSHRPLIAKTFSDYSKWGRMIGVSTAADLNYIVSQGKYDELIRLSETYYESQLSRIADTIYDNKENIKLILIAGPSSSGKTTTSKKLNVYLQSRGFRIHNISIDDYFVNRVDTPKDENGEYDFESLKAIDTELFNRQLAKLLDGEKVLLPKYNFITGKREFYKEHLQMQENDLIIIEGLHGLNEELTLSVPRKNKFKIFICPFTQLNIDYHNRIHTSDTRRLRRMVRDSKFRGMSAAETLKMWKKIREGEQKYIFPFQGDADAVINSALMYELGILKTYAEPLLFSVSEDDEMYPEAIRLINFLRNFLPIPSENVPRDSILREFIGGSGFEN